MRQNKCFPKSPSGFWIKNPRLQLWWCCCCCCCCHWYCCWWWWLWWCLWLWLLLSSLSLFFAHAKYEVQKHWEKFPGTPENACYCWCFFCCMIWCYEHWWVFFWWNWRFAIFLCTSWNFYYALAYCILPFRGQVVYQNPLRSGEADAWIWRTQLGVGTSSVASLVSVATPTWWLVTTSDSSPLHQQKHNDLQRTIHISCSSMLFVIHLHLLRIVCFVCVVRCWSIAYLYLFVIYIYSYIIL